MKPGLRGEPFTSSGTALPGFVFVSSPVVVPERCVTALVEFIHNACSSTTSCPVDLIRRGEISDWPVLSLLSPKGTSFGTQNTKYFVSLLCPWGLRYARVVRQTHDSIARPSLRSSCRALEHAGEGLRGEPIWGTRCTPSLTSDVCCGVGGCKLRGGCQGLSRHKM